MRGVIDMNRSITRRDLVRVGIGAAGLAVFAGLGVAFAAPRRDYEGYEVLHDNYVSVYAGKRLWVRRLSETEGVTVVNDDLVYGDPNWTDWYGCSLAGHVLWGMSVPPYQTTTTLAVGGDVVLQMKNEDKRPLLTGGNAHVGGTVDGVETRFRGGMVVGSHEDSRAIAIPTWDNCVDFDYGENGAEYYGFDGVDGCAIRTGLGTADGWYRRALVCENYDPGSDQPVVADYNRFWEVQVAPMIEELRARDATGTVSYSAEPAYDQVVYNSTSIHSDFDLRLTFFGDRDALLNVFDLDLSVVEAQMAQAGRRQLSLHFLNVPEDGGVLCVRVHGRNPQWRYGWRARLNENLVTVAINTPFGHPDLVAYRDLCERVLWLFDDDCGELYVDAAHAWFDGDGGRVDIYAPKSDDELTQTISDTTCPKELSRGNLWPGTVLVPGSAYVCGSTNGKLIVRDDLTLDTWEHHNSKWAYVEDGGLDFVKVPMHGGDPGTEGSWI